MDENDKIELIKILEDEELAEKIWQGWIELQNDPVWQKNTSGKTSVDLIGRSWRILQMNIIYNKIEER
ncbi:MAG: hypothetical protein ACE5KE_15240 [Methanosarcinales archaeon]